MTIGKRITNVLTVGALILSAGVAQANVEWVGPGNPATGVWEDPNNWWDGTINRLPINNEWIRPSTNATIIYSDASGTNLLPNSLFWWDTGLDHHTVIQTGGELQVSGLQMTQDKTDTNAPAYTISGGKLTAGSMNITWNNSSSVGSKFLQTARSRLTASSWLRKVALSRPPTIFRMATLWSMVPYTSGTAP